MIRTFKVIRNKPDGTEYEVGHLLDGVVFEDGTCVIRWRSEVRSTSIFKSFDEFNKIHGEEGHPEYNSQIIWYEMEKGLSKW